MGQHTTDRDSEYSRAVLRLTLGVMQIGGAVVTLVLLAVEGMTVASLALFASTTMLTLLSLALFRPWKDNNKRQNLGRR